MKRGTGLGMPGLTALSLDLARNQVGAAGAESLSAALRGMPVLTALTLDQAPQPTPC